MSRKARRTELSLVRGAGRRFFLGFFPPALAGAVLTVGLVQADAFTLLPGTWLLLYGVAVVAAGTFSVPPVPLMGAGFMVLGTLALLTPLWVGEFLLGIGFGFLHVGFGLYIAKNHGG